MNDFLHSFWLVWKIVSISFYAGYFDADLQYTADIQEREFPKDGFWLCIIPTVKAHGVNYSSAAHSTQDCCYYAGRLWNAWESHWANSGEQRDG